MQSNKMMVFGGLLIAATFAFLLVAMVGVGSLVTVASGTGNVVANVVVQRVCFISGISNTVINFGSIAPGQNVGTQNVVTVNDIGGNDAGTLTIGAGTGNALQGIFGNSIWLGTSGANQIGVTNTVYSSTLNTAWSSASLVGTSTSPASTGITLAAPSYATPITTATVYLGTAVPQGAPADTYTTNIIVEISCN